MPPCHHMHRLFISDKCVRVQLGPFFKWVLSPIWAQLFMFPARSITRNDFFSNHHRLKRDILKLRFWSVLQHVCITNLISIRLWELYQANDFFDCLLSQFSSPLPPIPAPPLYFSLFALRFFCLLPAVDGNTWAQVIALYPTLVECITCSSSEVSSALKEALGPFKDFMQPPVSRVQNGESWPGSRSVFVFYNEEILNVSSQPTCFTSARTWTPCEPHLRWHEATTRWT